MPDCDNFRQLMGPAELMCVQGKRASFLSVLQWACHVHRSPVLLTCFIPRCYRTSLAHQELGILVYRPCALQLTVPYRGALRSPPSGHCISGPPRKQNFRRWSWEWSDWVREDLPSTITGCPHELSGGQPSETEEQVSQISCGLCTVTEHSRARQQWAVLSS